MREENPSAPLVEMRGISKAFPGVRALEDVSLLIRAGQVHMLVGQNGAGKSTLVKVLCGATAPDRGQILFRGKPATLSSPADARALGIAVIFQEFSLVPYLDVAQNVFLGREFPGKLPGSINRRRMHAEAGRLLQMLGTELDTHTAVHRLGVAQQQMVEIAKALSQDARILVMDEPTAALSGREIERLFEVVRRLRREGVAIVYISHRLHEVFELGDWITVLRDGRKVASMSPADTRMAELVSLMVGREVDTTYRHRFCERPGEAVLEVRELHAENGLHGASLRVHSGEIVGLAGLVGAGRTELARAIFGADRITGGEIRMQGHALHASGADRGPVGSVRAGIGLVPEARKTQGLALIRSVQDNLLLAALRSLFPQGWYRPRHASRVSTELIGRLRVATPSPRRLTKFLSGGNQQKVVLGKWLTAGSRFFIFDEPTRGIDVGAKAEVFGLIESLVAGGAAVLMISSELPEIVAVCDRAYVMRDKTIVGELLRTELTEENILRLAWHHG
ncbi:MAG TPA: sugar ABC transporter ATP-binding protein [Burkholderiales bacterium]|nr:sugar ABC transporter ATP-binding protein [Burkholderiales bacterium]